MFQKMRNNIS